MFCDFFMTFYQCKMMEIYIKKGISITDGYGVGPNPDPYRTKMSRIRKSVNYRTVIWKET